MKMLAFLFLTISCYAAEVRITDRIIPYVQDGGGTSTSITIVNLEQTAAAFEILFLTETGAFWPVTLADQGALISDGAYVRGTIAAGRSVTFQTANAGSQTRFGHAIINSLDNARFGLSSVTGDLTFNAAPEREDALTLAFDNTAGKNTTLLWISDTPFAQVTYDILDDQGARLSTSRYQFPDGVVQRVIGMPDLAPETAGKRGTIQLQIDYPSAGIYDELYFSGLAIQADANGLRTVRPSLSVGSWKASRH